MLMSKAQTAGEVSQTFVCSLSARWKTENEGDDDASDSPTSGKFG